MTAADDIKLAEDLLAGIESEITKLRNRDQTEFEAKWLELLKCLKAAAEATVLQAKDVARLKNLIARHADAAMADIHEGPEAGNAIRQIRAEWEAEQ